MKDNLQQNNSIHGMAFLLQHYFVRNDSYTSTSCQNCASNAPLSPCFQAIARCRPKWSAPHLDQRGLQRWFKRLEVLQLFSHLSCRGPNSSSFFPCWCFFITKWHLNRMMNSLQISRIAWGSEISIRSMVPDNNRSWAETSGYGPVTWELW